MKRFNIVVLICVLGLVSLTSSVKALAGGSLLTSSRIPAFAFPSSEYIQVPGSLIEITNRPILRAQDGLTTCCAHAAVTLYVQAACRQNPKLDCTTMDERMIPSALSLAAIAETRGPADLKKNNSLSINNRTSIEQILIRGAEAYQVFSEACFPMNQFVARFNKGSAVEKVKASREVFLKLNQAYDKAKLEGSYACLECLNKELQADFGISTDIQKITEALTANSFDEFLHWILLGNCDKTNRFRSSNYRRWPEVISKEPAKIDDAIIKVQQLVKDKMAVGLYVCPYDIPTGDIAKCRGGNHCLVITGYQKVCKPNGDCRELVQVQSSWGLDWQHENNEGWLDAKTLLTHSDLGRSTQLIHILNL